MSDADNDKKRSRLGYQRITIACSHCRRRKIRCIPSEDESDQRCSNCIRLKKECVYYPVDQQTALDGHSESETSSRAKLPSIASSAVSSSPPHLSTRALGQHGQQHGVHQHLHIEAQSSMRGVRIAPSISPAATGSFSAPIPQSDHFGPEQHIPARPAHTPQQGHGPHTWDAYDQPGNFHRTTHVPMGNAIGMQTAYPAYTNPALQADVAPFPPPDITSAHQVYGDARVYNQQPAPTSQPWQQHQPQEQQTLYPQYQQHPVYHAPPQQNNQPPGYYPPTLRSNIGPMAPSQSPLPVQQTQFAVPPVQSSHLPGGHYPPAQQPPVHWHPTSPQHMSADDETHARYLGSHSARPG